MRRRKLSYANLAVIAVGAGLLTATVAVLLSDKQVRVNAKVDAEEIARSQYDYINSQLNKYRILPAIFSRQKESESLFRESVSKMYVESAVKQYTYIIGAADVALYRTDGSYLASARGVLPVNIRERPDTKELIAAPLEARLGRATLRNDDGRVLYAFSAAVGEIRSPVGVVVVYVDLSILEQTWATLRTPVLAVEKNGNIILSNISEWREENSENVIRDHEHSVKYRLNGKVHEGVLAVAELALVEWDIWVIGEHQNISTNRRFIVLLSLLLGIAVALLGIILYDHKERANRQERKKIADGIRLERLVQRRTKDLHETNCALTKEIEDRRSTEQKLISAQESVVQSAKLAAIGQLSATLSHEYNQPISAIGTYAENTEKLIDRGEHALAIENIGLILKQVQRMGSLSRTLMGFVHSDSDEMEVISLLSVLDDALILIGPLANKSNIRVRNNSVTGEWYIYGSKIRLSQIIVNIVNNAIDACVGRKNGLVEIDVTSSSVFYDISICDNGVGIAGDSEEKIFQPFYTTKRAGIGLGIGLMLVKQIVDEHKGKIFVRSREYDGTCFIVRLPKCYPVISES